MAGGIIAFACAVYLGGAMLTGYFAARTGNEKDPSGCAAAAWPILLPILLVEWAVEKGGRK